MLNVLENGWTLGKGLEDAVVVDTDDYGEDIYSGESHYEDYDLGVMSEETYNSLVKNIKTDCDKIATEQIIDVWNGEVIEVGERYLALVDGPVKIFDVTLMSDVAMHCEEIAA